MDTVVSPPRAHRLKDLQIKRLKEPGDHADGGGLYVHVSPTGTKSFCFKYERAGKRHEMGLGPYPTVSLDDARDKALEARRTLAGGQDPLAAKKAATAATVGRQTTFGQGIDTVLALKRVNWREHTARSWFNQLTRYVGRDWRNKPLTAISKEDILAILQPAPPVVAAILRARLETILDHAIAHGWHPGPNPARWKGNLKELNLWSKPETRHHPAIDWRSLPAFVQELRTELTFNRLVLEFLILTAGRSAEVRGALWSEIDLGAALWRLPVDRMKTKKEHVVPLSRRALEILQWMADRRHNDRVFPGRNFGGTMDSDALRNLLPKGAALLPPGSVLWGRSKGPSLHGMRSAFMDWCGDNEAIEVPMEVAERALSHAIGGQNFRSYRRGTALEKRRVLMQQWADFLDGVS